MSKPVPDKAEIALEYPDKFYVGTFEHTSRFEAHLEPTGLALTLERPGPEDVRKSIHMHLNYGLLAAILDEITAGLASRPNIDVTGDGSQGERLRESVAALHRVLNAS
ncbi:hypothetical protein [Bradyrhizobium sp. STM 3809]|uniref:hypothetical protein n=1 Tax=Bradyrhizobium sp. STM 3809 TaxID=551936 RepID=UPI000240A36D|nr:hypothetical protein [Bradyrhizobium sp. STM 3809]CCE03726.1 conserved hypothetical protein [Bradyrhizobium sp. STM 3809]